MKCEAQKEAKSQQTACDAANAYKLPFICDHFEGE